MGLMGTMTEVLMALILIFASSILSLIIFQVYRRRHNNTHVEAPAIFEDPSSLKKVYVWRSRRKYISLIIPAFNEEHRLPGALDETMSYLQQRAAKDKSFTFEVWFAFDFVRKYMDNVRVILLGKIMEREKLLENIVKQVCFILVVNYFDLWMRDGATKVDDLEKLENRIHAIAKKEFHLGDSTTSDPIIFSCFTLLTLFSFINVIHLMFQRKWYRNFLMKGFHIVVLLAAGPGIRDTQCGFKMFTRAAARKLFINIRLKRWCFDVELVFLCKWFNIPMIEISVNWSEIPGSKVNLFSIPNMLWELVLMSVGYRTGIWRVYN
ncbi:hypothetical protein K2173_020511 [Erythroxylum novogranatense]|uniref:Dolichyl-phosphate beta-glucosyltransferase n=1 Tax=Erythroxylum novogranatense TaxID=1862640 RepID=A0AAV8TID6_9ROSI|nr:hypothetical protein K2173_020511 [Erythroxylum novogranatense]